MFATHATEISRECEQSPAAFREMLLFVVATIQEPLERVPAAMDDIRNEGEHSAALWGMKRRAYRAIAREYKALHSAIYSARALSRPLWRERALIAVVEAIPGINLAKAGFVLQLATGTVGCLDTHNRRRFNLDKVRIRPEKGMKYKTMLRHAADYVRACDTLGGCEYLWDSWCEYVAQQRPEAFPGGAFEVSSYHLCSINPF